MIATVLALLGCLLAGPAVAAFALVRQIDDQDRYLAAVAPLVDDPVVRQAIGDQVTDAIGRAHGPGDRELPASAHRIVAIAVTKVVDSEGFRQAWSTATRVAHPEVIAMLRGDPGRLRIEGETVLLDLGGLADEVKARLVVEGVPFAERLPEVTVSIPLVSRPAIRRAVPAYGIPRALHLALPLTVGALLAAAMIVSPRRTRTLLIAGVGIAVAMLLVLLYVWIVRAQVTSRSRSPELGGAFYDALTGSLTTLLWIIGAVGLVGAAITWTAARTVRRAV